ncbi:MAG: hypothetical protein NC400_08210 [Clostridium sp.]|nr:hypothetical protein [Clostridium sp.]
MSLQTIEMHFAEVMKLSEQLSGLAEVLKTLGSEEIMRISAAGKSCWNSKCADIVAGKEVKLGMELVSEAEVLLEIAKELERRAQKMYRTEILNSRLAATRIYL